jgi:hypothetical protein
VDRGGQGRRACHRGAIPAEQYEHVDNEADAIAEQFESVVMENLRNDHQFHKFEQMVVNTFHEPDTATCVVVVDDLSISKKSKYEVDMSKLARVAMVS